MSIRLASLGIFSIQRENPGGAPVIKIIHVVDQRIKIPLLFQIKIIGEKFFVKNQCLSSGVELCDFYHRSHQLIQLLPL